MMDRAVTEFDRFSTARNRLEEKLRSAKAGLLDASQSAIDRTRRTAEAADAYVRGNPWTAVGIAIGAGALIGFLAAKR